MFIKLILGFRKFQGSTFKEMESIFELLSLGQFPEVLFITCSDSRVVPTLIIDGDPGDLFVVRNVGNIIPPFATHNASSEAVAIEYAIKVLKVKHIIVCGHSGCGAMEGLMKPNIGQELPTLASWLKHSSSVIEHFKDKQGVQLEDVVKQNILAQIEHLKTYPVISNKLASQELAIHGWFYKIKSGEIHVYDENQKEFLHFEQAVKTSLEDRKNKVVKQIIHHYLEQCLQPKTATEFQEAMRLSALIKSDLTPIWEHVKPLVEKKLWEEIGELYSSPADQEFQALLDSGVTMKLEDLEELKVKLQNSSGYHQFCSQHTLFTSTSDTSNANSDLENFHYPK
ncbi:carbonic anhydrase [Legionella jordanis]|uniref:carbonic anhydrase n=1 Tax=Legionella jordanis TaxID=456 RepID=A0A0W0VBC0_9GAMM|nr:carbonic anhydrase [Legionella jordanis]KTD17395.1 (beta)-carbonic anhydrase [Legionella jordanis]RMX01839.1 carbonic anhydrase [Legionella jordanis]RMX15503.1 carbonic anhydrase [Legionella jordanis]VEH11584.1 (beta)-carbonic anhydrase [Legionella jordanis]HAT8714658.1 carbonic anhydrase [Legionella jordanis]